MNKVIFALACLISLSHADTLSLRAAQEKLFQQSPELLIQRAEHYRAAARLEEARASLWPSLDASASYQAFSKATQINLALPPPIGTVNKTLGDKDREEYGIDLSYPLFLGGGRRQQIRAQLSSVEAQEERFHAVQNQLSLRLAALFYGWHQAEAMRQTLDTVAGYDREYADRMAKLVKGGAALSSRAAAARARLLGAEVELQAASDLRDSLGRATALMLGLPPGNALAFATEDISSDSSSPTGKRPELAYLEKTSASLGYQEKSILSGRFPVLVGLLGYRVANPGLNQGSDAYMNYGLVGIQVKWNLFDGFSNEAQRAETRGQRDEIQTELHRQSAWFDESMLSAQRSLARLQQSREAAQASLDAARMALSETRTQHEHGAATDLELLDAQVQEAKSALQVRQLVLQQRMAGWQWRYARGENLKFPGDQND